MKLGVPRGSAGDPAPVTEPVAGCVLRLRGLAGDADHHLVAGAGVLRLVLANEDVRPGGAIDRMRPQVAALVLNANGDPARFVGLGLPVVADSIADFAGPLAGVLAGLDWAAANRPDCPLVLSVATDAPFLPEDLAARLADGIADASADLACAASGGVFTIIVSGVQSLSPATLPPELAIAPPGVSFPLASRRCA